jgi:pimeloyl-ACP methyl ester carboxylesterase
MQEQTGRLDRGDGVQLAWSLLPGQGPTLVFLPGFASDMTGTKATALATLCAARGQPMLRLDYSGHGASGGDFATGTIGSWTSDALAVIAAVAPPGPLVLAGSSMGGWIALLLARALRHRVAGLIGIAAAPDFTERLIWEALAPSERAALMRDGHLLMPSQYGEPTLLTRALVEDGRTRLVLEAPIPLTVPVRLLHGMADPDVPWELALRIAERLDSADVQITLVKDGDHRLSRPADLDLLAGVASALLDLVAQDRG